MSKYLGWRAVAILVVMHFPLVACQYPQVQSVIGGETAYVKVKDAPKGAVILIDGRDMGPTKTSPPPPASGNARRSPSATTVVEYLFPVRPGVHRVKVLNGEVTLVDKEIYSGSAGITEIEIPIR